MRSAASRWATTFLFVGVVSIASTPSKSDSARMPADEQQDTEVRRVVERYEHVWNTHDASAVAAFFEEDADMLFGNGPLLRGRKAIRDFWGTYFAHIDEEREGKFTIDSVRLIAPNVALVNVDSRTEGNGSDGQALPVRLARGTWVVVREGGVWQISALRGFPAEGEVRTGPGVDR